MKRSRAFSLVEIALALGVIAFALVAVVGVIPVGLQASRDSVDLTRTSMIAQDAAMRLPTLPYTDATAKIKATDSPNSDNPWLYDVNGHWLAYAKGSTPPYAKAYYRVYITRDVPTSYPPNTDPASRPASNNYSTRLLAATVTINWPLDPNTGNPIGGPYKTAVYPLLTRAMP